MMFESGSSVSCCSCSRFLAGACVELRILSLRQTTIDSEGKAVWSPATVDFLRRGIV